MPPSSAATFIEPQSGDTFSLTDLIWRAPNGAPLNVSPLAGITRTEIDTAERSLWRYRAGLPLKIDDPVSMGEGCTPLYSGEFAGHPCHFKLEWFAPTGSFKDRGASVLISYLKQMGVDAVCEDSSGNGGAAIAGYGAAAGMHVEVLVPAHTQPAKIAQVRAYGANITLVPGPREATEAAAMAMADTVFYASHNWHPMFLQGTKSLGYEIWEDLGFRLPDAVVIPCGAGSNVLGCYMAFKELLAAGETDRMPRIYLTQPSNCAPIHASFVAGAEDCIDIAPDLTIAEGTAIRRPIRTREILAALRETSGGTAAVGEGDIASAALTLARSGVYVEPTCAHAAAGFRQLIDDGQISAGEDVVLVMTGTGIKATPFYADQFS